MNSIVIAKPALSLITVLFSFLPNLFAATIESAATNNWNLGTTWVGGVVPTASDDVVIKSGHTVTLNDTRSCTALTVNGTLNANTGGNLTQSGSTAIAGTLNLNGGALDFSQVFNLSGNCNVTSGTYNFGSGGGFTGAGTVTANGGTTNFNAGSTLTTNLTLSGGGTLNDNVGLSPNAVTLTNGTYGGTGSPSFASLNWSGATITGSGTVTVTGSFSASGNVSRPMSGSKELHIAGAANFTASAGIQMSGTAKVVVLSGGSFGTSFGSISGSASNAFEVLAGGEVSSSGTGNFSAPFNSNGSVNVTGGSLTISGPSNSFSGGTATVGGTLLFSGTATNISGTSFSGAGTVMANGGTTNFNAGSSLTTNLTLSGGGTLNDNVGLSPNAVTFTNGTFGGTGSPSLAILNWSGVTITGSGTVTVAGSFSAAGNVSRPMSGSKELHIAGAANFTASAGIQMSGTAKVTVLSGGSFGTSFGSISGSATNAFEVLAGGEVNSSGNGNIQVPFTSNGNVNVTGGTLTISGPSNSFSGGTATVGGTLLFAGTTTNISGTSFTGAGTVTANGGTTNFNAGSTLTNNLTLSGGGTLNDNVGLSPNAVTLTNGTFGGTGSPSLASLTWSGGTISGSGTVTVAGSFSASGNVSRPMSGSKELHIGGAASFSASAGIQMSGTTKVIVLSGGSFGSAFGTISGTASNTFEVQTGGNLTSGVAGIIQALFTNNGSVNVSGGTLNITQANTHNGTFSVAAGATLNFSNTSANTTLTNSILTNNGTISVGGGRSLVIGGAALQELEGTGTSISHMTLNNTAGLNISGSQTISTFNFDAGNVQLTGGDVTITTLQDGGPSNFFETTATGRLIMPVTGAKTFPVGPSSGIYNPVILQQASGSVTFGIRVSPSMSNAPINGGYVNREWQIDAISGSPNANVTLAWSPGETLGGFDENECSVAHFNGVRWDELDLGMADCSGLCTRTAAAVTQFSPFGVIDGAALPVELVYFNGKHLSQGSVLLQWQTATELNNEGFHVEKSTDGKRFNAIGFMPGNGTSLETRNYQYKDDHFIADAYYRLKQMDFDGRSSFSNIIFLKSPTENKPSLYPNPATTELFIEQVPSEPSEALELKLYDGLGRLVYQKQWHDLVDLARIRVPLTSIPAGIYTLSLTQGPATWVERVQVAR
jgi:fibronectin-binding autotransporter adhesin